MKYAVLIDGGFYIQKFKSHHRCMPSAGDVSDLIDRIRLIQDVRTWRMLRSYFYHARPYDGIVKNPINGSTTNYSDTPVFREQNSLLDSIELMPSFALRLGELSQNSWRLGNRALRQLARQPRVIEADDLVPDISQKGVDLRIGLDIARLALRETVDLIVVVSGDSDLIPAFKFARREGLQVLLVPFDHGVKRELKAHADRVIDLQL